jgi:hypothetical protein
MKTDPLEMLEHVGRLELKPGDILVFRSKLMLDKDQVNALWERIEEHLGAYLREWGVKSIVVTCDMDVGVLRKGATQNG